MDNFQPFYEYLIHDFVSKKGKPYSVKSAHDMVSRLKHVKELLGNRFTKSNILNDTALSKMIHTVKEQKKSASRQYYLYLPYILSLNLYRKYLEHKPR